jgi:glycosyltransferase involved in cell wall biosynthesis
MNNEDKLAPSALTLVIPTYNRANLIAETIDAALIQTQAFAEIIVIDDGSADNTQ